MNRYKNIQQLFKEQVAINGYGIAIRFHGMDMSYQELDRKSDRIAQMLTNAGIKRNSLVGLMLKRSPSMIAGMIGIFKAGGAYVPLDPDYPDARIQFILNDCKPDAVLTQVSLAERVDIGGSILLVDGENVPDSEPCFIPIENRQDDLAYIIYTSGTTGMPKGVMIKHGSILNLIENISGVVNYNPGKSVLALNSVSFDISVMELVVPVTRGMTIVLVDEDVQKNPRLLSQSLIENNVDILQMTPSNMQLLVNYQKGLDCLKGLKEILIGGEAFPLKLLKTLQSSVQSKIFNLYGPTETAVWTTVSDLTCKSSIDIGHPIANTQVYICDSEGNIQPDGLEGELCIGGRGLAKGYFNNPKLTAEKFVLNPIVPEEIMYKTGDYARLLPDGNIEYLGRIDNQVKIRGYRIELEEIEGCLLKFGPIKQTAITAREGKDGVKYLCAYYVSEEELMIDDIRSFLSETLPDYMIPSYFIRLDCLPQTLNGKIDRKSLPDHEGFIDPPSEEFAEKPGNDGVILNLKKIISDNMDVPLPVEQINTTSTLYEIGISSLTFIKIIVAIENAYGFEFGDTELYANNFPNIQSLILYVENRLKQKGEHGYGFRK